MKELDISKVFDKDYLNPNSEFGYVITIDFPFEDTEEMRSVTEPFCSAFYSWCKDKVNLNKFFIFPVCNASKFEPILWEIEDESELDTLIHYGW